MERHSQLKKSKAPLRLEKDTTFDKIFAHYVQDAELTDKQEEIRQRWEAAWTLMCNYHSPDQTKAMIAKQFNISERQALRDIKNSILLFGDVSKTSKEAYRHLLFEYSMKAWQIAAKDRNADGMNRAVSNMIKIKGLDKADPDGVDWERLEQHEIRIKVPKDMMRAMKEMLQKGAVDLDEAIDVPFEEVD